MVYISKISVSQQGALSENAAFCGPSLGPQLLTEVLTACRNREPGLPGFLSHLIFASYDTPRNRLRNIHSFHVWFLGDFFPPYLKEDLNRLKSIYFPAKQSENQYKSTFKKVYPKLQNRYIN